MNRLKTQKRMDFMNIFYITSIFLSLFFCSISHADDNQSLDNPEEIILNENKKIPDIYIHLKIPYFAIKQSDKYKLISIAIDPENRFFLIQEIKSGKYEAYEKHLEYPKSFYIFDLDSIIENSFCMTYYGAHIAFPDIKFDPSLYGFDDAKKNPELFSISDK